MTTSRPPISTELSFAAYVATRPIPANGWGDYVRHAMKNGGLPQFASWDELRRFTESCRDFDIRTNEARAVWSAYQTMLRTAERKAAMMASEV